MEWQLFFYTTVWTASVLYSVYAFVEVTSANIYRLQDGDFKRGWFFGLPQDSSDLEWTVMKNFFPLHFLSLLCHTFVMNRLLSLHTMTRQITSVIFSSIVLCCMLSFRALCLIWLNILLSIIVHIFCYHLISYFLFFVFMVILHTEHFKNTSYIFSGDVSRNFLLQVSFGWLNARCLSFALDRNHRQSKSESLAKELPQILAYCFYLPIFYTGPIVNYSQFIKSTSNRKVKPRLFTFAKLFRYSCWAVLFDILLHFVHCSALHYHPEVATTFSSWPLAGFGYCLCCMFYLKYLVIYGFAKAFAEFDGVDIPPPPKCITRIHRSSYLWRHFDRGLHLWLVAYFYKPIMGIKPTLQHKVMATALSFTAVCIWHGTDLSIVIWCSLNFLGIMFEIIALLSKDVCPGLIPKTMQCWIASPFFLLMVVSNIFFLSNVDVGLLFVRRFLTSFSIPMFNTLAIMAAGCHVSNYWQKFEEQTPKM